jgi:hypothetical protein
MNPSLHLFGLVPAACLREGEAVRVLTPREVRWGTPVFRAPALPTPHQMHCELPFTANFRPQLRSRTGWSKKHFREKLAAQFSVSKVIR